MFVYNINSFIVVNCGSSEIIFSSDNKILLFNIKNTSLHVTM